MKRFDEPLKKHFWKVYGLLLLAAAAIYGVFSLNRLVWADEAYTFALLGHSFKEIWNITAADVHPPLYYFLLKVLAAPFGYNLNVCKFLSALPCIGLMAVAGWQLRKLFSERLAVLFMLLYLMYPYTMSYAVEVRMYSLAEFLIMVNAIYAYRCWKFNQAKDWAVFALAGTGAALTHYFALVSAGIAYIILFIAAVAKNRKLLKGWLLASAATVVLYLPWLGCFVMQLLEKVNNEYWIEPITLSTIVNYVRTVFSANAFYTFPLFCGVAFVVAFVLLLVSKKKENIILCLCSLAIPLGTVAIGLAASILVRPVFVIRYLLPSVPLIIFFYAFVLSQLTDEMLFTVLATVVVLGGISNMTYLAKHALIPEPDRLTAQKIAALPEHSAYVIGSYISLHPAQEFAYYEPQTPVYTPDIIDAANPYPNRIHIDKFDMQEHGSIIWVSDAGMPVPPELLPFYNVQEIYNVTITGVSYTMWHLTPIQ